MSEREARIARNESLSREVNESIEYVSGRRTGPVTMLCECGRIDCEARIAISIREYEEVRTDGRRFAVVSEHVLPDVEEIVARTDRFVVVQKVAGTSTEVAEDLNPRD